MSGDVSVYSRFLLKFVEIIAAGLATAVSGYLIAHLSGVLSSPVSAPARAVIEESAKAGPPAQPPSWISGDLIDQHTVPKQEGAPSPVSQSAPPASPAKNAVPRKQTGAATNAPESKGDLHSLAARVRAALATMDANRADADRTGQLAVPPRDNYRLNPAGPASPQVEPSAFLSHGPGTGAAPPSTGEFGPIPAQKTESNPPVPIEVQSRPVVSVQPSPTPPADKQTGTLSDLEDMLRHDPLAGSEEAPRPPLPVGE
jgi:hypothetical protein